MTNIPEKFPLTIEVKSVDKKTMNARNQRLLLSWPASLAESGYSRAGVNLTESFSLSELPSGIDVCYNLVFNYFWIVLCVYFTKYSLSVLSSFLVIKCLCNECGLIWHFRVQIVFMNTWCYVGIPFAVGRLCVGHLFQLMKFWVLVDLIYLW